MKTRCAASLMLARAFIASALIASPLALADNRYAYSGWSWSVNTDQLMLDKTIAKRSDIQLGERIYTLGLGGEYFNSNSDMTYSFGLNYLSFDDKNPFYLEQDDGSYDKSSAWGYMFYAEAGPKIRMGQNDAGFFTARLGYSTMSASREVSNCSDCYSEDLDINSGLYGVLGLGYSFSYLDVSLQYQQYFEGDLNSGLRLKISTTF